VLIKSQLWQRYSQNTTYIYLLRVVHMAVNNYMFRHLCRPSSGCTPSCYKVIHAIYNVSVAGHELTVTARSGHHLIMKNSTEFYKFNQNIPIGHHTHCSGGHNPNFILICFTWNIVILDMFQFSTTTINYI
jgi:hypothetical protein